MLNIKKQNYLGVLLLSDGALVDPGTGVRCEPGEGAIVGPPGLGASVICPVIWPVVPVKSQTGVWQQGFI